MFNKRIGLLLVAVFSSMMLIIACSSDTTVDSKKSDNTITNPGGNGDNSGGNGGDSGGDSGSGSGGDTDNGGSDGDNGNNGNGNTDTEKPLPPKSQITLDCNGEYYINDSYTLEVKTDDNRELNEITWREFTGNPELTINPSGNTITFSTTQSNTYFVEAKEAETDYIATCSFHVDQPRIEVDNYNHTLTVGQTKNITYSFVPNKFNQEVEIEGTAPEGYEIKINQGTISVKSLKEQGMSQITLISKDKKIKSQPIILSSSNDYKFTLDKSSTGSTDFADNEARTFKVKVNKNSEFTSYNLVNTFPEWLKMTGPEKLSPTIDQYTFNVEKNDRVRKRSYEIVFLPGNISDTTNRNAQKILVKQERNYAPEVRVIKFFKGAKQHAPSDFEEELNTVKDFYKTNKLPEYYLYENGAEGWFNANKIVGREASNAKDSNMCWMYTATNGLHWWFEHNKTEIDKYLKHKNFEVNDPDKYGKGFYNTKYIPSKNLDPATFSDKANMIARENKSEIAKLFRQEFNRNIGGWTDQAVLWYIAGKEYVDVQGGVRKPGFGFFKDVFPSDVSDLVYRKSLTGMTQDKLNELFKTAVENDRILLLNIRYKNGALHAINLWGYVEDKYGDVCEIYVGDNNLPSSMDYDTGNDKDLVNAPVFGKPSDSYLIKFGLDIYDGDLYLMNLTSKRSHATLINVIYELDLGKKYFKEYFKNNGIN